MTKPTGFHVRHDLQPSLTHEVLLLLKALPSNPTKGQLRQTAQAKGYKLGERKEYNKLLQSLTDLGILISHKEPIALTEIGSIVATVTAYYPHLLPEVIHFLYYTIWDKDQNQRFSWSYRIVCDLLWRNSPCTIDRDYLVNKVTQEALQLFQINGVSFSTSSIAGILNWLAELQPPTLVRQDKQHLFVRRSYCSVELFVLTLHHIYRLEKKVNTFILLTPQLRERICQICLISPEAFDELLEQTASCFSKLQIRRERGERFALVDFSLTDLVEQEMLI